MTTPESEVETPGQSILGRLKARKSAIAAAQTIDIPIPRWDDPALVIRARPIKQAILDKGFRMVQNAKPVDRGELTIDSNCDVIIAATTPEPGMNNVGLFAMDGDKEISLHPDGPDMAFTGFDEELARMLEMDTSIRVPTARQIVRYVFFTDGDIVAVSNKIVEFSGYTNPNSMQALLGE